MDSLVAVALAACVFLPICICFFAGRGLLPRAEHKALGRARRIHRAILAHRARRELELLGREWEAGQ